uniref:Uncharacterized protein n=1 Tax=Anopheles melas TaxID=34690 RepID=A0A182U0R3_9DIPT
MMIGIAPSGSNAHAGEYKGGFSRRGFKMVKVSVPASRPMQQEGEWKKQGENVDSSLELPEPVNPSGSIISATVHRSQVTVAVGEVWVGSTPWTIPVNYDDFGRFRAIPAIPGDSDQFRAIPGDSGRFQTIPDGSNDSARFRRFQTILDDSGRFRLVPSPQKCLCRHRREQAELGDGPSHCPVPSASLRFCPNAFTLLQPENDSPRRTCAMCFTVALNCLSSMFQHSGGRHMGKF